MNAQEQWWTGEAGDSYTARNRVNWWARMPFWAKVMGETVPSSVMEFGCNAGFNLMAIRALRFRMAITGIEINELAAKQASSAGFPVMQRIPSSYTYDLVFTAGVLIHVAPENLQQTMRSIANHSDKYVLSVEYESEVEEEIEYRGEMGKLWRRPFGKLYEDMGLKLVEKWPAEGFDRCTAWLMSK